jgi:hypothetical protein
MLEMHKEKVLPKIRLLRTRGVEEHQGGRESSGDHVVTARISARSRIISALVLDRVGRVEDIEAQHQHCKNEQSVVVEHSERHGLAGSNLILQLLSATGGD